MSDIIDRLGELGNWVSDKEWHQHPIAAEAQRVIRSLRANHKDIVEIKRGTDARLKVALAALQKIYDMTKHDDPSEELILQINEIAVVGFETATRNVPRHEWDQPEVISR